MIDRVTFTGGLSKLALQLNKPAEKQLLDAYFEAMSDETDPAEWLDFVRVAAKRWGSEWAGFLPPVPALLDALREFRKPAPAAYLGPSTMSPEELRADEERRRQSITEGLERIRQAAGVPAEAPAPRGGEFKRAVAPREVVATDERLAELRAQARELVRESSERELEAHAVEPASPVQENETSEVQP